MQINLVYPYLSAETRGLITILWVYHNLDSLAAFYFQHHNPARDDFGVIIFATLQTGKHRRNSKMEIIFDRKTACLV